MVRKVTISYKKVKKVFKVNKLDDWERVVEFLIGLMKSGTIIALSGDLGAGKTTLTQFIAKRLGVTKRALSPTFALIRSYILHRSSYNIRRLVHVDAYRIGDERDLPVLDLDEELLEPGTVIVIEWPERISIWLNKQEEKIEVYIELIS